MIKILYFGADTATSKKVIVSTSIAAVLLRYNRVVDLPRNLYGLTSKQSFCDPVVSLNCASVFDNSVATAVTSCTNFLYRFLDGISGIYPGNSIA